MHRSIVLLAMAGGCGSSAPDVVLPADAVHCGGGAAGEVRGGPTPFVVAPAWFPQSGETPSRLVVAAGDPGLVFYLKYTRQPPPVGEVLDQDTALVIDMRHADGPFAHLIIDESDAATTPVCVAGRFELTFEDAPIAGWFRTR